MILGTTYVSGDEKAMGLYEMNEQSPKSSGFHRYQIIHVIRNDEVVEYREDMGLAKNFKANQMRIPSYMEHTVDELKEIANQRRGVNLFEKGELVLGKHQKEE